MINAYAEAMNAGKGKTKPTGEHGAESKSAGSAVLKNMFWGKALNGDKTS